MKRAIAIIIAALLATSAMAELTVTRGNFDEDANEEIRVDNGIIRLVIDPAMGGIINSLVYHDTELTGEIGILEDHLWGQEPFRGDFFQKPYIAEVKQLDDRVEVQLSRTGETGDLKFIEICKTVIVRDGRADVQVDYAYRNAPRSRLAMEVSPWFHNLLYSTGVNTCYIPTTDGVIERIYDPEAETAQEFYREPSRGWLGGIGENGVGYVCTMDYPHLESLYTFFGHKTGATMEWRFVPTMVNFGDEFTTSFSIMPFVGLPALHGAGGGVAGGITVDEAASRATVDLVAAAPVEGRLVTSLRTLTTGETVELAATDISLQPGESKSVSVELPTGGTDVAINARVLAADGTLLTDLERAWMRAGEARYAMEPLEPRIRMAADEVPWRYELSYDYQMPSVPLAPKLPGGPLSAFFMLDMQTLRDIVELDQRIDLEAKYGTIIAREGADRFTHWIDPQLGKPREARKKGLDALAGDIAGAGDLDVLVIGDSYQRKYKRHDLSWQTLPAEAREAIVERVKSGTGLVYVSPQEADGELAAAIEAAQPVVEAHWITTGYAFDLLPGYRLDGIRVGQLGEGRIVVMNGPCWGLCPDTFYFGTDFAHEEMYYSLVARAMLWAAGREPAQGLGQMRAADDQLQIDMAGAPPEGLSVDVTLWRGKHEMIGELQAPVAAGMRSVSLPLPEGIPAGDCFATARLRHADGTVADWRSQQILIERPLSIIEVVLSSNAAAPGEEITAAATVANHGAEQRECEVLFEVSDNWGRVVQRATQTATVPAAGDAPGTVEVPWRFAVREPLAVKHYVTATVSDGERMAAESATLFVPEAWGPKEPFHLLLWGGHNSTAFHAYPEMLRQARRAGFDIEHSGTNWYIDDHTQFAPEANMRLNVCNINRVHIADTKLLAQWQETHDLALLERKPCFNDPEYRQSATEGRLHMAAEAARNYGPITYQLGDEMSLTTEGGGSPFDVCYSQWCLAGFRDKLREQFGTVAALNAAWHSDWASFDEIVPLTWEQAVETGNPSSWLAHRDYMNEVYAEWFRFSRDRIREIDPDALVGESGIQPKFSAYGGYDWSRRMEYENVLSFYGTGDIPISLGDREASMLGSWSIGYCGVEEDEREDIWRSLLHGQNMLSYWYVPLMVSPDLTLTPYGEFMKPYLQELQAGTGDMLGHADYVWSPVAIHHSMLSCELSFLLKHVSEVDTYRAWTDNIMEWNDELRRWGHIPRFVSDRQIEAGELIDAGYRVLVMPLSLVVTDAEAEQIARFVEQGGTVIADAQTGIYDQHGQPRAQGALDEILGVTRSGSALTLKGAQFTTPGGESFRAAISEAGVRTSGEALATGAGRSVEFGGMTVRFGGSSGAANVAEHRQGQGRGIYLGAAKFDFSLPRGSFLRDLMQRLEVTAAASITAPDGTPIPAEVGHFREGAAQYAGTLLLRGHATRLDLPEQVTVTLPTAGHVWEVRSGRYLGQGASVTDAIEPGVARLYAVLPESPELEVDAPASVMRGETLQLRLSSNLDGGYPVRVELCGPDGQPREWHDGVHFAAAEGTEVRLPLALNAETGAWTVRLTEVITGEESIINVQVQ